MYDIWALNGSVKDMNHWTTITGDLFIVAKVCIEPAILFRVNW